MRRFAVSALLAIPLALCVSAASASPEYPWCARYDWTTTNCGFTSFQQCLATISGIGGRCEQNPRYVPQQRRQPARG